MTTNVEQFTSAGLDTTFWGRNNSAGYLMGPNGSLSAGADASMSRLLGANRLNLPLKPPRQVNVPGDDGVQSIFFFEAVELPSGDLVVGVFDADFFAQSQGTNVYADGDFDIVIGQPDSPNYNPLTILTNSQAKSRKSGSSGNPGFAVKLYPKVQSVPLGDAGIENAKDTSYTHALIADKSNTYPWGTALSEANEGTTGGAVVGPFFSENRVCMHTFIADGSDVTFTLLFTPAAANGSKVKAWKNGVLQTYTTHYSVNTGTKVFTLAAAGSSDDIWEVRYEYVQ